MSHYFLSFACVLFVLVSLSQQRARAWQSDNGNGTFNNPVLYADYPDPDIIRVNDDFYMVSTTFVDSPGITVLHSKDMVNWEIASHCATNVDGGNAFNLIGGTAYESGFWASSIRHRNGMFYVAVNPTFTNGRIYYATNAAGPWQYHQLNQAIYDPGLFFDTDGTGYIAYGHGPQSIATLNSDCSQIVAVSNNVVNSGGEGSHLVKRGSYYYLFNANPSVWPFQLRCSRASNLFGAWETGRVVLTATTGGHQGAIVDINDSDQWFGFVHQDSGAIGRMPRIGPVFWENNWPVFGTAGARDQIAASYTKPVAGQPIMQPAISDEFTNATLGLQWQWNHNPDNARWSLTERPGFLRLRPTLATNFWVARNTLTQKGQGPQSHGIAKFDLSNLQPGDVAGFGTLGKVSANIAVTVGAGGSRTLRTTMIKDEVGSYSWDTGVTISGNTLYLRTDLNFTNNLGICSYSTNGTTWTKLGGNFELMWGYGSTFQGEKFAIFCYNTNTAASPGYVDVDSFTFGDTAPQVTVQRGRPKLNAARTTFVADNGQPLRGPYTSTEWTSAAPQAEIEKIKNLGCNAVHLYTEVFDPNWPTSGNAPGYNVAEVDKIVQRTRDLGLYLVMTIGNGANNGNHNRQWATNFWNFYAPRYANETHVIFEIHNEPMAWGPSYLTGTTPPGTLDMEIAAYRAIRAGAPQTPVLLFSYAVLSGSGGANAALTDIRAFNQTVFGNQNAVWTNEAVAFHGYGGWEGTITAVSALITAGYPCFMTEFGWPDWGTSSGVSLEIEVTADLERLGVSWLTFQYIPPSGVSSPVTIPGLFKDPVDHAGLGWTPDYGTWPVARGVFGNGGQARAAVANWVNNFLTGTVRIQAEDYDWGGEGVSFHDTDASNNGGQYRPGEPVDLATCNDAGGGFKVGWTADGEWLEYTILVREPGLYDCRLRYATPNSGCAVEIISNVTDTTGWRTLSPTGGYTTWATATTQVYLGYGRQKLRVQIPTGGFDLNWIELSPAATGIIANGNYKFLNAASTLAMEAVASNDTVIASSYSGASVQHWNVQHMGGGQYKILSVANSRSWNSSDDALGLASSWNTGNDRCFIPLPSGGGFHRFVQVGSGLSLFASAVNGSPVQQQTYSGAGSQQWVILPPATPLFPAGLSATATSATQVLLTWKPVSGATNYNIKRSATSGGPYTILAGVNVTNYTDTVIAGMRYYYVVSAQSGGQESPNSLEASVNPPYPWVSLDIGAVGVAGGVAFSNGVFAVGGSGADIWGTTDAFRFTYVPVTGNCTITARVLAVQNTDQWAKAGVMIRATTNANSANAFIAVTPGNGVTFQTRSTAGGTSGFNNTTGLTAPYWVRLVRSGNTFTAFRSPNGSTWTQQGSATTISMAATVYVGLALTSHNNSSLCTATFDNVTVPGWPNWTVPSAPTSLSGLAQDAQAALTWTASGNTISYNVKRSTLNGGPYTPVANVTTTNYTDPGLTNSTTYYYVVSALNPAGESGNSPQASVTPQSFAPTGLSALAVSATQINLNWNPLASATSYNVKRSLTSGGPYATIASGVTATSYPDNTVAGGTIFYYVVSAMVSGSETTDSAQATATTLSPVVGSLVHRYSFSETSGTNVADSVGGPIWTGTLPSGGTFSGSQVALGAGQFASLPTGIVGGLSNATFIAWVNLTAINYWSHLFDFGNDTTSYLYLTPRNGFDYTARFAISTSGPLGEQKINCGVAVEPGGWHQVAVTLNAGTGILYLDGVPVGTNAAMTLSPAVLGNTTRNYLGRSQSVSDPYLNGALDEFRIHNAALSAVEIQATVALGPDELLSTNLPVLSLTVTGGDVTLSWPLFNAGFTVQSRTNLMTGDWGDVTSPAPQIVGQQWQVTLPTSTDSSAFYRLVK
jgi:endoglucanase